MVSADELMALASLAGQTVVTAAVTDAWESVRRGLARLLGRGDADRTKLAEQRLDQTREQLTGPPGGDLEQIRSGLQAVWTTRLADLLEEVPAAEPELRALVDEVGARLAEAGGQVTNVISGGTQHGPVLMGRDFHGVTFGAAPAELDDGT